MFWVFFSSYCFLTISTCTSHLLCFSLNAFSFLCSWESCDHVYKDAVAIAGDRWLEIIFKLGDDSLGFVSELKLRSLRKLDDWADAGLRLRRGRVRLVVLEVQFALTRRQGVVVPIGHQKRVAVGRRRAVRRFGGRSWRSQCECVFNAADKVRWPKNSKS